MMIREAGKTKLGDVNVDNRQRPNPFHFVKMQKKKEKLQPWQPLDFGLF